MKKLYLQLLMILTTSAVFGQTIVSTSPENKNALIEDFTGLNCGFCPMGHKEIQVFLNDHPDDAFAIAIHQGAYAVPQGNQPDYTTVYGDELAQYFNISGWPSGVINRHDFGAGYTYSLDQWQAHMGTIITQPAYVNVACEASIDVQTRQMTVHVETYYTGNSPLTTNRLTVVMNQNNVKGPQWSSWFNPDMITPDGLYLHQHMLREMITDTWGEEISPTVSGTFIDQYYNYTIPEALKDVPVRLGDLEILSFISEDQTETINASGCIPSLTNFSCTYDAGIESLSLPPSACSNVEGKITLVNHGSETITSVLMEVSVNGENPVEFVWEGDQMGPYQARDFEIPAVFFEQAGANTYTVTILEVNGNQDENPANDTASADFGVPPEVSLPVMLHLETDYNAWGTTWKLYDAQNNVIQQGDAYTNNSVYDIELDVDAGCYKFVMMDSDGFFSGYYSITDGNNTVIVENSNFGNKEVTYFTLPIYPPTVFIDASTTTVCAGGTVQFYDASLGGPDTWHWTFEGGIPAESFEKNPEVTYLNEGSYDVTLEISNSMGSDQLTETGYITVTSLSYGNVALNFNGVNQYVEIEDESAFDITEAITLEVWIKPENTNIPMEGVLSKNYGDNAHPYQMRLLNDEVEVGFYSNTIGWQHTSTTNANLPSGEWSHIAFTYDRSYMKIYVNGEQKATKYFTSPIPANDQPFEIGRTNDVVYKYFKGTIDEVRVWNVARTQSEIAENMCANFTGTTDTTLIAYYKFNECGGTVLSDVGPGGHSGICMNMAGDEWVESDACPVYSITFEVSEQAGAVPVEDAQINMGNSMKFTDGDGVAVFEGYEPGNYSFVVTKDGYLETTGTTEIADEDVTVEIDFLPVGIGEPFSGKTQIFPNPANRKLNIRCSARFGLHTVVVYDIYGNKVLGRSMAGTGILDVSALPNGMYFIRLIGSEKVETSGFVIEK
jgi:PKD repeat protein